MPDPAQNAAFLNAQKAAHAQSTEAGKTFDAAIGQMKIELAKSFAENRDSLASLMGVEASKLNPAQMAIDWVEKGAITINDKAYNRQELLDALATKITEGNGLLNGLKLSPEQRAAALGVFRATEEDLKDPAKFAAGKIPSQEHFLTAASAASGAVAENTSWFSQIWHAIAGFFSWMSGGFQGNLYDHIGESAGSAVAAKAGENIQQMRAQNPYFAAFFDDKKLGAMQTGLRNGVRDALNGVEAPAVTYDTINAAIAGIKPAVVKLENGSINKQMIPGMLEAYARKQMDESTDAKVKGLDAADKTTVAKGVAAGLMKALEDPKIKGMLGDKDKLKAHVVGHVRASVGEACQSWWGRQTAIDSAGNQVGEAIDKNFGLIQTLGVQNAGAFLDALQNAAPAPDRTSSLPQQRPDFAYLGVKQQGIHPEKDERRPPGDQPVPQPMFARGPSANAEQGLG